MKVLDASALVELLLGSPRGAWVRETLAKRGAERGRLHAPAHLDVEVAQALRRIASAGEAPAERCGAALELLARFPLQRHLSAPFLARIWEYRGILTAYDAAYVVLAETLGCPLVTLDRRLAAAPGLPVEVLTPHER